MQVHEPQQLTDEELAAVLNAQAGKLNWSECQRHYARGVVIKVACSLDLIQVALALVRDNKIQIENWLADGKIANASDEDAHLWQQQDTLFWALVVAPWVLVQEIHPATNG